MGAKLSRPMKAKETDNESAETQTTDHIERYKLLGLGRGLDITKESPWLERTSFQVRDPSNEKIAVTEHGRQFTSYTEEVESRETRNVVLKAGVKATTLPAGLSVATEYSRSNLTKKYIVGTKIINRTVSFVQDFSDIPHDTDSGRVETHDEDDGNGVPAPQEPHPDPADSNEEEVKLKRNKADSKVKPEENIETFEQRLLRWLTECCKYRGVSLEDGDGKIICENIHGDTQRFVEHLGITHYVSAIELGAVQYKDVSVVKYETLKSVGNNASLDAVPYASIEANTKLKSTKSSHTKKTSTSEIGAINFSKRKVAPQDEAVIGCRILPISSLVRNPSLEKCLKCCTLDYIMKSCSGKSA